MLKIDKDTKNVIVCYDPFIFRWGGFGDGWRFCSCLLELSEKNPKKAIVADCTTRTKEFLNLMKPLFDTTGDFQYDLPEKHNSATHYRMNWQMFFEHRQLRTKKYWEEVKTKKICYQFDGFCEANSKNPSEEDIKYFVDMSRKHGYNPINIGGYMPIGDIIDTMMSSKLFIGCPSGMATMSLSTGIPMHIVTNKLTKHRSDEIRDTWYEGRRNIKFHNNLHDFIESITTNEPIKLL